LIANLCQWFEFSEHPEKDVPSSTPSTSTRTSEPSKIPPEEDAYFLEGKSKL